MRPSAAIGNREGRATRGAHRNLSHSAEPQTSSGCIAKAGGKRPGSYATFWSQTVVPLKQAKEDPAQLLHNIHILL